MHLKIAHHNKAVDKVGSPPFPSTLSTASIGPQASLTLGTTPRISVEKEAQATGSLRRVREVDSAHDVTDIIAQH